MLYFYVPVKLALQATKPHSLRPRASFSASIKVLGITWDRIKEEFWCTENSGTPL